MTSSIAATVLLAGLLAGFGAVLAPRMATAQNTSPAAFQAYRPGLGDLMTMTVQPRHIKLGLAGRAKNWPYAEYELHELEESFERVVRVWPKYKGLPLGGMLDAIAKAVAPVGGYGRDNLIGGCRGISVEFCNTIGVNVDSRFVTTIPQSDGISRADNEATCAIWVAEV